MLSGEDPGPEATILAMPCKKLNGIAPSTIPDYVGIKGVFAIADVPTGFFYVETFQPEGDPVAAAEAVLADPDPFDASGSAPVRRSVPWSRLPRPFRRTVDPRRPFRSRSERSLIVGVGGGLVLRSRSQRSRASQRRGPAKARPAQKAGTKTKTGTSKGGRSEADEGPPLGHG